MYFNKTTRNTLFAAIAGLLLVSQSSAQQAPAAAPVMVPPKPLQQEGQIMPGFGNEGLIKARYTVKADGTTANVEILGGLSTPFYENMIKMNIPKWTFTPGTVNGEPKDFLNQEHVFKFRVAGQLSVTKDVDIQSDVVRKHIAEKNYAAAKETIDKVTAKMLHTVFDYALMNQLMVGVQTGLGNPYAALEASLRATQSSLDINGKPEFMLPPDLLENALKQQLVLAASLRQQGEVLRTWAVLESVFHTPAEGKLYEWVTAAKQQMALTKEPLVALARVPDDGHYNFVPTHRIFTVSDVREGKLDKVVAHCARRTLELEYKDNVDWSLPAGLGACKLDFMGSKGTLFSIAEFAQ